MESADLYFDLEKSILISTTKNNGKKKWIKKINDIYSVNSIIEDSNKYYISCETDETSGQFLAISKQDGTTCWFIPGKSYLHILFNKYLYIIFIDDNNMYFLIKVDINDGSKIWHHKVRQNLEEYSFTKERILLQYSSGKNEILSPLTGIIKGDIINN